MHHGVKASACAAEPVIVVGGGLAGLCASIEVARLMVNWGVEPTGTGFFVGFQGWKP